jgi:hypothetical protein
MQLSCWWWVTGLQNLMLRLLVRLVDERVFSKCGSAAMGSFVLAVDMHLPAAAAAAAAVVQVSSPQLSLLEATLASMTRVDAFIMMRQQRSPGNVFDEAARCGTSWGWQGDAAAAAAACSC